MLSMALLAKGFSANSTKTDEINQAVEHIHHAKKDPHFIGFDPSEISKKTASLTQPRKKSTVWYSCATWATPPSSSMQLGQPSRRTK